jgi:hypothetical protein
MGEPLKWYDAKATRLSSKPWPKSGVSACMRAGAITTSSRSCCRSINMRKQQRATESSSGIGRTRSGRESATFPDGGVAGARVNDRPRTIRLARSVGARLRLLELWQRRVARQDRVDNCQRHVRLMRLHGRQGRVAPFNGPGRMI